MPTLAHAYGSGQFGLSFELFPPKTEQGDRALLRHVRRLMERQPHYITCTYGAGGSTQDKTLEITARVHQEFQVPVATHLTCVGRTVDQLRTYLAEAVRHGVTSVVALRGDPPEGEENFHVTEGGFGYANELVAMIKSDFPQMGIAVGGYPEVHQEAPSREVDLENLQRKVDVGADVVITQLFYDNADYFRFREDCERLKIQVPIVPGLLPITNCDQIKRITALCGASLPEDLTRRLLGAGEDSEEQIRVGVEFATRQTQELIDAGAPGVHFYVLNKSEATTRVLDAVTLPG